MNSLKKNILSIIIVVLTGAWISFTYFSNLNNNNEIYSAPQKGFLAPDFKLNDIDGNEYQLSEFKDHLVIVNVWASWCKPCQYEMPAMQKIYDQHKDEGLILLAVNNTYQDSVSNVLNFVESNQLTFPILLDIEGDVSALYKVQALPSTYFIDRSGMISEIIIGGPMSEALIESKIIEMDN
ncbi:MAG: redoxin domain-containing protein [Anaerolineaceae bacterium]|nr:redoxin domain-containing protein [Anaerolineaceae bacterium]